jgi:hypothetical protein
VAYWARFSRSYSLELCIIAQSSQSNTRHESSPTLSCGQGWAGLCSDQRVGWETKGVLLQFRFKSRRQFLTLTDHMIRCGFSKTGMAKLKIQHVSSLMNCAFKWNKRQLSSLKYTNTDFDHLCYTPLDLSVYLELLQCNSCLYIFCKYLFLEDDSLPGYRAL